MGIDATDLFDRYEEDYEDMVGGGVPHLEINKMHISQSVEVIFGFRAIFCCLAHAETESHKSGLCHCRLLSPQKTRLFCLVPCQLTMEMGAAPLPWP